MRRITLVLALLALTVPAPAAAAQPPIRHVFVLMLENKGFDETFGWLSPAHYLAWSLPGMGALVPNYYGVTHQSLGNYLALVSGQGSNPVTQADCPVFLPVLPGGLGSDGQALGAGCVYPSAVKTVADQLSARGLSWKGYMEDMGTACRHPALLTPDSTQTARKGDQYAARHNPFVYFDSLAASCPQNDVPLDRLPADLRSAATTPNFSLITPNLCNDGHDSPCVDGRPGGLVSADAFLRNWVPQILASPAYKADGLLVIAFDESDGSDASACCGEPQFPNTPNNGGEFPGRGGGRVGAVMLSPFIDAGTIDHTYYNHFSLLRSVEDLFGLGHLGYAAQAGAQTLGPDLFTCYRPTVPRPRRGRLPAGSEIKLSVISQGTASRPSVVVKLWHPGRVTLKAGRRKLGGVRTAGACQALTLRLPSRHGAVVVTARAFGGSEQRTIRY